MAQFLSLLCWTLATVLALPSLMLAWECFVGSRRCAGVAVGRDGIVDAAPPFVVLMPAHDEEAGIGEVVAGVLEQLRPCDALLVVADNCSDDTAAIARGLGARVIERADPALRGKGYALEFGRAWIAQNLPDRAATVVVVLDADCRPDPGALPRLVASAAQRDAVVQGAYLMVPPTGAGPQVRVSCLAFLVKNLVRQEGLDRIAGAALLQGSGMAFPRAVFARMHWASASLVEDLDMGLALLLEGCAVRFEQGARFLSDASTEQGTQSQRRRWEHGVLQGTVDHVPRLVGAAMNPFRATGRPRHSLLLVACDLLVPPTVLLLLLHLALTAVLLAGVGLGIGSGPLVLALAAQAILASALSLAWWRSGRGLLSPRNLLEVPGYIAWKVPLIAQFFVRRERRWVRTERTR